MPATRISASCNKRKKEVEEKKQSKYKQIHDKGQMVKNKFLIHFYKTIKLLLEIRNTTSCNERKKKVRRRNKIKENKKMDAKNTVYSIIYYKKLSAF